MFVQPIQPSYNEKLLPYLTTALKNRGYDVQLSFAGLDSIVYNLVGSLEGNDILVSYKNRVFTVSRWTWISEDYAIYQWADAISLEEVLACVVA